jgi:amidase
MASAPLTAVEMTQRMASGQLTATEVTRDALARIAQHDGALNAFTTVLADDARREATRLDAALAAGEPLGPLHGVPVAVKENLDVAGCVTSLGGRGNSTPASTDCEVVRRIRQAGAIVIGTTRMPELGQWPHTESVHGGITRNPWDETRTAGGSSGGSAVAVAAGMVPVALGTDGGGSVRIPAACCGVFGLKPSRGRVTSSPWPSRWSGLVTTGPLARTVLDAALLGDVVRGSTAVDEFTLAEPTISFAAAAASEPTRLRIGWSAHPFAKGPRVAAEHIHAVKDIARLLSDLGHDVREIDPEVPKSAAVFLPLFLAGMREAADGVEHFDRLERRTRRMYRSGTWVTPTVLAKAQQARHRVAAEANRVFNRVDVLLTPTLAQRPCRAGVLNARGALRQMFRSRPMAVFTSSWNVAGNPAAAIPAGLAGDGLPIGVQIVGRIGDETSLLSLSAQVERARPWPAIDAS